MNLQNIPARDEEYQQVRRLFIAPPGMWWVKADAAQQELRILAELSQDAAMCAAFERGESVHRINMRIVLEVTGWEESDLVYRWTKNNPSFGLVYGAEPQRFVATATQYGLPLTLEQATILKRRILEAWPAIPAYQARVREQALRDGYTVTAFGRKRWWPELKLARGALREHLLRAAVNHTIQGTGADLLKHAILLLFQRGILDSQHQLIHLVHDELDFYCPEGDREWVARLAQTLLDVPRSLQPSWRIPMPWDISVGRSWADTTPIDTAPSFDVQ